MSISINKFGIYNTAECFLIDLKDFKIYSKRINRFYPFFKLIMPLNSDFGDIVFTGSEVKIKFSAVNKRRYIKCDLVDFFDNKNFYCNLELTENTSESLNVSVCEKGSKTSFFTNRFIPNITASGTVTFGGREYLLTNINSSAFFDWFRYSLSENVNHTQLISSGENKNKKMSVHLGGGNFGTAQGIENCIFIDGKIIKLGTIKSRVKSNDLTSAGFFSNKEKSFYVKFIPSTKGGNYINKTIKQKTLIYGNIYGSFTDKDGKVFHIDGFDALFIKMVL